MEQVFEAIYRNGVLTLLEPIYLADEQHVTIVIRSLANGGAVHQLAEWQQVYVGLTDDDIQDVEEIALDRTSFSRERE